MAKLEEVLHLRESVVYPGHDLILAVLHTARRLSQAGNRLLRVFGLTESQFNLLMLLNYQRPEGGTQVDLSDLMLVGKANMTGLIDRLERDGHVERRRSAEDRRVHLVVITLQGKRKLEEVEDAYFLEIRKTTSGIPASARKRAVQTMIQVCQSLDKYGL